MFRSALAFGAMALTVAPAFAGTYLAKPASPTNGRFIARDIVWRCGPDACQGTTEAGRPFTLCQSLAKRAGRIDSFIADGRALSADELARCNASAKAGAAAARAAQ